MKRNRAHTDRRTPLRQVIVDLAHVEQTLGEYVFELSHLAAAYELLHRQSEARGTTILALKQELRTLQLQVRQRDDVVASLHQQLEHCETRNQLLRARRTRDSDETFVCEVCCDDVRPWDVVWCGRRDDGQTPHATCTELKVKVYVVCVTVYVYMKERVRSVYMKMKVLLLSINPLES